MRKVVPIKKTHREFTEGLNYVVDCINNGVNENAIKGFAITLMHADNNVQCVFMERDGDNVALVGAAEILKSMILMDFDGEFDG